MADLTPTQWAALVKVGELGSVSQNQLGRDTAMDAATIKGVVDRLIKRGLVKASADPGDHRRSLITLTPPGRDALTAGLPIAAPHHRGNGQSADGRRNANPARAAAEDLLTSSVYLHLLRFVQPFVYQRRMV